MKKIALAALLFGNFAFSQITKNPGDFNKVTAFDRIDITLVKSNENKVILNGKDSDLVELVNKNGELKVRMPVNRILDGDNITATVYYKDLNALEANEGTHISGNDAIKSDNFNIIAKEGGQINISLDVQRLEMKASQGANIELQGTAASQDILLNSGAVYKAELLDSQYISITVNAGGEADINASESVDAKVRAGGDIRVYGNPKKLEKKIVAGGSIEEAK